MIKYWQSTQDYKYLLTGSQAHFDSSERNLLHTELWKIWQKLRLFDTDRVMEFLLPLYSATGRPAKNQPQILRSFILFFLAMWPHTTKAPYCLLGRHRRTYPHLSQRAPQGRRIGQPAAFLRH